MAVRKFKPTTPGQRHKIIGTFKEITAFVPEKSLTFGKRSTGAVIMMVTELRVIVEVVISVNSA